MSIFTAEPFPPSPRTARIEALLVERLGDDGMLPMGTLTAVAAEVGVSRERVRQIAAVRGYAVRKPSRCYRDEQRTCVNCGTDFVWTARMQTSRHYNLSHGRVLYFDQTTAICSPRCATMYAAKLREPRQHARALAGGAVLVTTRELAQRRVRAPRRRRVRS